MLGSAILLLYSGVSFTRRLQKMYRAAWGQEKAGVRGNLYAALALVVFMVEVLVVYVIMSLIHRCRPTGCWRCRSPSSPAWFRGPRSHTC